MTNTRITDSEVFERRYPVLLREFSLREGSAGQGMHVGGEGVIRDIEFRIPVQVSILSERRVYHPYGMEGGGDAACGLNIWVRKVDKKAIDKNSDSKRPTEPQEDAGREPTTSGAVEALEKNDASREGEQEEYRYINLGAKNTASMRPGERIIIHTPGGGGWGKKGEQSRVEEKKDPKESWKGGSIAGRQSTAEASA
jgi:5-oxoprolinase (ATP-hydrolysing)